MKKQVKLKHKDHLKDLSLAVGDFIRYWGFRRIHGAIWTQIYLSPTPLTCTELAKRLGLSKALISPALDELCDYRLIYQVLSENQKMKYFRACEDVQEVIRHILQIREQSILNRINKDFEKLNQSKELLKEVDETKLSELGRMIVSANFLLGCLLEQTDFTQLADKWNS